MLGHVIKTQIRDRKDKREERSDTGRIKRMQATGKKMVMITIQHQDQKTLRENQR